MYDMLQTTFAPDCQIEMDLEILIIDDYVSNIAERINLYNELDNCETEEEWTNFEKELIDRFGPVPESTKEMILALRLRWVGKAIGIEKLVLKEQINRLFHSQPRFSALPISVVNQGAELCAEKPKPDHLKRV